MPITLNGSAGVTTSSGAVYDGLQTGTAVTASGTSVDFTGIPSWAKRITVMFQGVSTSGLSPVQIQLGTSGGFVTTGYLGTNGYINNSVITIGNLTSGLGAGGTIAATDIRHGLIIINNLSGNNWVHSVTMGFSNAANQGLASGSIGLSGVLDRIRITTVNGTDTFDAGTINIMYE